MKRKNLIEVALKAYGEGIAETGKPETLEEWEKRLRAGLDAKSAELAKQRENKTD